MMEKKNYCFAGIEIQIAMPAEIMYTDDRYLAPFRVDTVTDPHIFTFEFCDKLTAPVTECIVAKPGFRVYNENDTDIRYIGSVEQGWHNAYIRVSHKDKRHHIELKKEQFTGRVGTHTVLSAIAAEHLIAQNNGLVFHCSYINYNGKAILFTAPSETGKSTQADLWNKYRGAEIVNGDRAALIIKDGKLYAAGIPFAGSSTHCKNQTLPLAAIVYLRQAPVTTIHKLSGYQAFARLWEGVSANTWDKSDMENISTLVKHIVENVPVFYMPCTPDESAVKALEKALEGEIR